MRLKGATVAIEGMGNVGSFAARYLSNNGAKIVAMSDSHGTVYNEKGLDFRKLSQAKKKTGSVINYPGGKKMESWTLFEVECDVLIPAAIPNSINESNVDKIKARIVVEGANIPATYEIEKELHERGILVVPDIVANAGGVISSYAEYKGEKPREMFTLVESKIKKNTKLILERSEKEDEMPRDAALAIAEKRIRSAAKL